MRIRTAAIQTIFFLCNLCQTMLLALKLRNTHSFICKEENNVKTIKPFLIFLQKKLAVAVVARIFAAFNKF